MAEVEIPQVAFVKGEISPIAAARTDSKDYQNALQTLQNFFVHPEGGVSNRPGLQFVGNCLSNTPNGSYLLPFVFNNQQTYVVEFAAGSMQLFSQGAFVQNASSTATITNIVITFPIHGPAFFSVTASNSFAAGNVVTISGVVATPGSISVNGIWVLTFANASGFTFNLPTGSGTNFTYLNSGTASIPFNLTNPYALADLPNLRWAQSADTLSIVVQTNPLYQLKRQAPTAFTFAAPTLLFGPFQDLNTDSSTTVYASAVNGTVFITASKGIFQPSHVGALFTIQEQFFNSIVAWEAQKILVQSGSPVGMYCRSNGNIYQCVAATTSPDKTATGTFQPVHTQGTQTDGDGSIVPNFASVCGVSWQFVSTNAGVAQITSYISATQVKATVQISSGISSNFPPTVVGGPVSVAGPYSFTGNGTAVTFSPLTAATTTDPNQFYVTVSGAFIDPSQYTISGTSIKFYTAPANGAAIVVNQVVGTLTNIYAPASPPVAVPLTGLCLSTYWAFGAISAVQGYPSDVCFHNDRFVLSGTTLQPQSLWTSKVGNYLNFGVSNPQVDSDAITATINARQQNPINNLLPMNNLLLGTASASWRVTGSSNLGTITPSDLSVIPQEFFGMQPVPALQTGTTVLYVQWGGRKLRDIIYQFYNDKFQGTELTVFARHMFPFGTTITRLAYAPEPYGLIYCVRSDGVLCVCTYLPEQQVLAWSRYVTAGNFEDVVVVPETITDELKSFSSFSVYVIVGRTIGGAYQRYIERFTAREPDDVNDYFFVDSGLTYDGRNFSTTTMTVTGGTTWLANDVGTLTSSIAEFVSTDPTNANVIFLTDGFGNRLCRLLITAFTSVTQVSVTFLDPVPSQIQGVATVNWTFARTMFSGLTNLIGQTVSVFADGAVIPNVAPVDVTGSITLPNAGGVVHAGLPYTCQVQSLNLNVQNQAPIRNRAKTLPRASIIVDQSYPFLVGPDFSHLEPIEQRQFEPWGQPVSPHTGVLHIQLQTEPSDDATLCIQSTDPVPVRILGWMVSTDIGEAG